MIIVFSYAESILQVMMDLKTHKVLIKCLVGNQMKHIILNLSHYILPFYTA